MKIIKILFKTIRIVFEVLQIIVLTCCDPLLVISSWILEKTGVVPSKKGDLSRSSELETNTSTLPKHRIFFPMEEDLKGLAWAEPFGTDFHHAWINCPKPKWLIYLAAGRASSVKDLIGAVRECIDTVMHPPEVPQGSGQMFGFIAAGSTNLLEVADKAIRGESSPEACMEAANLAHSESNSIFPGACQTEEEACEASEIQHALVSIKFLLIALAEYKTAPDTVFAQKETVRDAFRIFLDDPDRDDRVDALGKICFSLAGAIENLDFACAHQNYRETIQRHTALF